MILFFLSGNNDTLFDQDDIQDTYHETAGDIKRLPKAILNTLSIALKYNPKFLDYINNNGVLNTIIIALIELHDAFIEKEMPISEDMREYILYSLSLEWGFYINDAIELYNRQLNNRDEIIKQQSELTAKIISAILDIMQIEKDEYLEEVDPIGKWLDTKQAQNMEQNARWN